jgi:hypothetical protein
MMSIKQSNQLQGVLRDEMLRSLVSPRRTEPRPLEQSELLVEMVLPHIRRDPLVRLLLSQPSADVVPEQLYEPLSRIFRKSMEEISRADLLSVSTAALAAAAGVDEPMINKLKADLLGKPFRPPGDEPQTGPTSDG